MQDRQQIETRNVSQYAAMKSRCQVASVAARIGRRKIGPLYIISYKGYCAKRYGEVRTSVSQLYTIYSVGEALNSR